MIFLGGDFIKKTEKLEIIKWYIKHNIDITKVINIDSISDLKELEKLVRTNKNVFGEMSICYQCTSDGKDYCNRCANCVGWHWDSNIPDEECVDNYRFRYQYWKTFYNIENEK